MCAWTCEKKCQTILRSQLIFTERAWEGILITILFKIIITLMSFLFLSRFSRSLHVIKKSCSVQGTYKRKMSTVSSTASNAGPHIPLHSRYKVYGNPRCWEDCRREASGIFCQAHGDDCNILA